MWPEEAGLLSAVLLQDAQIQTRVQLRAQVQLGGEYRADSTKAGRETATKVHANVMCLEQRGKTVCKRSETEKWQSRKISGNIAVWVVSAAPGEFLSLRSIF